MGTELAVQDAGRVVEFDAFRRRLEEKRELIRQQLAPGCPDKELEFFIEQCVRLQLDPIVKQAYFVKRRAKQGNDWIDRWSFQVGIDGFRSVADRTGTYAGSDDASFEYAPERPGGKPSKATVTVWKIVQGQRCPFTASARWDEYFPGERQGAMWDKMPHVMLAKVAEALALRKGFPAQLGGIYIPEEMHQADAQQPAEVATDPVIEAAVRVVSQGHPEAVVVEEIPSEETPTAEAVIAKLKALEPGDDAGFRGVVGWLNANKKVFSPSGWAEVRDVVAETKVRVTADV